MAKLFVILVQREENGVKGICYKIISSSTLRLRVLFGSTMLLVTTTSSSTITASPAKQSKGFQSISRALSMENKAIIEMKQVEDTYQGL